MKTLINKIIFLNINLLLLLNNSCSIIQKKYIYSSCNYKEYIFLEGLNNILIQVDNSLIVKLNGNIKSNNKNSSLNNIEFIDVFSNQSFPLDIDKNGNFKSSLPKGSKYNLSINKFEIHEFLFNSGEVRLLKIDIDIIGEYIDYTVEFKNKKEYKKALKKENKSSLLEYLD